MKALHKIIFSLILFITPLYTPLYAQAIDYLFVAYDMGDLNALRPVAEALSKKKKKVVLLSFGTAYQQLHSGKPLSYLPSTTVEKSLTSDLKRDQALTDQELGVITQNYTPKVVVAGMACLAQAQVLNAFPKSKTVAYYDNFEDPKTKDYIQPFMKIVRLSDLKKIYVPCVATQKLFQDYLKTQDASPDVAVAGSPALESWDDVFKKIKAQEIRTRLNIPESSKVIVFAGGYDPTYQEAFRQFTKGVKDLKDVVVLVTHHPKTDGSTEDQIIRDENASNVRLIRSVATKEQGEQNAKQSDAQLLTTPALCVLASVVACHQSSVGFQALYKNKAVLYVADKSKYKNMLIDSDLASITNDAEGVEKEVKDILATPKKDRSLKALGLPAAQTQTFLKALETL